MNEREKVFEVKLVITAPECECDNEPTEEEIEELIIDDLAHYAEVAANGFNVLAKDFMHDYELASVISGISRMYMEEHSAAAMMSLYTLFVGAGMDYPAGEMSEAMDLCDWDESHANWFMECFFDDDNIDDYLLEAFMGQCVEACDTKSNVEED